MNAGSAVRARILELCKQRGITLNRLATTSGITQSTLNNIVNSGSNNPTVSTIKKICDGLEIRLSDFFDAPVFDQLDQEVR